MAHQKVQNTFYSWYSVPIELTLLCFFMCTCTVFNFCLSPNRFHQTRQKTEESKQKKWRSLL